MADDELGLCCNTNNENPLNVTVSPNTDSAVYCIITSAEKVSVTVETQGI